MPDVEAKTSEKTAAKKPKSNNKRIEGLKRYVVETKAELKKIVWPTRKQTLTQTLLVLVSIAVMGVLIWGLDSLTMLGLGAILKK